MYNFSWIKILLFYRLFTAIGKVFFLFINYRSILWLITDTGVFFTQNYWWYPKINHHKVKKISWNVLYLCSISSYPGLTALLFEIGYFICNISITISWSLNHIHNKYVICKKSKYSSYEYNTIHKYQFT